MDLHRQVYERLLHAKDESYAAFMQRLIPNCKPLLGVRVPVLRREAARLASQNAWEAYFAEPDATHEEQMIHAFLFSRVRDDDALQREAARWMDEIQNWCVCDAFCQSYLTARRQSAQTKRMIQQLAASQEEFRQRTAFVLCLGCPRAARQVGWAMRHCPPALPWHRIVRADGAIAGGDVYAKIRRARLEEEGVAFLADGRVDMRAFLWRPQEEETL